LIQAKNIHKSYGDLHVLKGVDCLVEKGEVVAIVGPSGAGKSTLLHILGTLDKPDQGQVFFNGLKTDFGNSRSNAAFKNKEIGFVFQFHHLLPEFNALENVCIPAYIAKQKKAEAEGKAKELLELMGLKDRMNHFPSEMSGGEQQRVAVARALINTPSVVLADEPSGNLDSGSAEELHNLFFKLRDELKQTFVIVTHNKDLANMADRKLEMNDGLIIDAV